MRIASKRSFLNLALFACLLAGLPVAAATPWGWGLVGLPLLIWGAAFLGLVHKRLWSALAFWLILALIQWQIAAVGLIAWGLFCAVRQSLHSEGPSEPMSENSLFEYNPGSGLPMTDYGVDVGGNLWGEGGLTDDD